MCPQGTYTATPGVLPCLGCPIGSNCKDDVKLDCPKAQYCNAMNMSIGILCPAGRYGNTTGLTNSNCSGPCRAGYMCRGGSENDTVDVCGVWGEGGGGGGIFYLLRPFSAWAHGPTHLLRLAPLPPSPAALSRLPFLPAVCIAFLGGCCARPCHPPASLNPLAGSDNYCPTGQGPIPIAAGFYGDLSADKTSPNASSYWTVQSPCPPGYYCEGLSKNYTACPAG